MTLPAAPAQVVDASGQPRCGRFAGLAREVDWSALAPPFARSAWWRRFHHKRWHYVALSTPEVFCAVAIVDVGWTNTAFAYVFDRRARRLVAEFSQDGLPGLTAALADRAQDASRFRFLHTAIEVGPDHLRLRCRDFSIDATFAGAAPVLLAVGEPAGGAVHATQKSGGLAMQGTVSVRGTTWTLDGGSASYDYSNGLLARETAWRWASAHAPGLGFNLQAGYFGASENALWIDARLWPLGPAIFDYTPGDASAPWHVRTEDGLLDLHFTPEGARSEDKNLVVAASRYVQPIGVFNGWVRAGADAEPVRVVNLAGVTEDHFSRW